ncbi:MAG: type I-F CRISPR-associated protein Csy2 [Alcanivoracaceae bacterium]|nr:type I-F CRISPR-associated protein Csy2 [Alcanivoracaceae bacterium]
MAECPKFEHLLILPRLRVQNANAISSPLTHGFPAMSAFLGLMWALERQTHALGLDLRFASVGVVAHGFDEQVTEEGFVKSFHLTRNPISKDGKTAAIVEEGRIHLDVSLVFAVNSKALQDPTQAKTIATQVAGLVSGMRIAGGTVIPSSLSVRRTAPYVESFTGDSDGQIQLFNRLKMRLLPGFVLVERPDMLTQRHNALLQKNAQTTRLDAWLSLARINYTWRSDAEKADTTQAKSDTKGKWQHDREGLGWLVPIPLGYGALTDVQAAGTVTNARNSTTPFCFVESLFGIGQWLSPHRLQKPEQLLWYGDSLPEQGLYRCRNDYHTTPVYEFDFD